MNALEEMEPQSAPDELENYRRLVELQSQIVELADQNRETHRQCCLLRKHFEPEARANLLFRCRLGFAGMFGRLRHAWHFRTLSRFVDRLRRRPNAVPARWTESSDQPPTLLPN